MNGWSLGLRSGGTLGGTDPPLAFPVICWRDALDTERAKVAAHGSREGFPDSLVGRLNKGNQKTS